MTDRVDISWFRDRLIQATGLSDGDAGEEIRRAMSAGLLTASAMSATRRPESSATYSTEHDFGFDDYEIPRHYWDSVSVDWLERRPYFRFFSDGQVWLVAELTLDRASAIAFLRTKDPLRQQPVPAASESLPNGVKGPGGRGGVVDWEKCLIEAARWMYVNGRPAKQADLYRHIADWLGPNAPGETQIKTHLRPLYLAFEQEDRSG